MSPDRLRRALFAAAAAGLTVGCNTGMFTSATTLRSARGDVTAVLSDADDFPRFRLPDHGERADATDLDDEDDLLLVERYGEARALVVDEMSWHHVAEGTLGGHPIAVVY